MTENEGGGSCNSADVNDGWRTNNLRGFKRKDVKANNVNPEDDTEINPNHSTQSTPVHQNNRTDDSSESQGQNKRYCHYFVNTGKCDYEAKTGSKCKYMHKSAPICHSGVNCTRQMCMFSHPRVRPQQRSTTNTPSQGNFLGEMRSFPQTINPWQIQNIMNPWSFPMQQINPWNFANQNVNWQAQQNRN